VAGRRFEEHRPHLRAVAYRMLGSLPKADDAVQDAWLRLSRAGAARWRTWAAG
jgi:RNA polymerase sigma-70 factor (ECF subfamily)